MSAPGFHIELDALSTHEGELRQIADQVKNCVDASGEAQAAFDLNAFGLIGQVFALPIQAWVSSATGLLNDAADAGHEVADRLNTAHGMISTNEAATTKALTTVGKEIPE
jgi:hypothetical protein